MADAPFRFLDLPAELRCMVYERLPEYEEHFTLRLPQLPNRPPIEITTYYGRVNPAEMLATCRMVYEEAKKIVHDRVYTWGAFSGPQMVCKSDSDPMSDWAQNLFYGLARAIMTELTSIRVAAEPSAADKGFYIMSRVYSWPSGYEDAINVLEEAQRESGCEMEVLEFIRRTAHQIFRTERQQEALSENPTKTSFAICYDIIEGP